MLDRIITEVARASSDTDEMEEIRKKFQQSNDQSQSTRKELAFYIHDSSKNVKKFNMQ